MSQLQLPHGVLIKENSWLARLAAWKLKTKSVALVFGNTIHLHGADSKTFLANISWVKHELKHIEQYRQLGRFRFLTTYVIEWLKHGYHNNRFEVEAREAERDF